MGSQLKWPNVPRADPWVPSSSSSAHRISWFVYRFAFRDFSFFKGADFTLVCLGGVVGLMDGIVTDECDFFLRLFRFMQYLTLVALLV